MSAGQVYQNFCQSCRVRHLQCDGEKPSCGMCKKHDRSCVPHFNVRFSTKRARKTPNDGPRKRAHSWSVDKSWSPSNERPPPTSKGPETTATVPQTGIYEENDQTMPDSNVESQAINSCLLNTPGSAGIESLYVPDSAERNDHWSHSPMSPAPPDIHFDFDPINLPSVGMPYEAESGHLYTNHSVVANPRQGNLLQHFKTVLGGPWLDITDPFFSTEVTRLAPHCPVLLYSVLALSSFDISRKDKAKFEEAEFFHEEGVKVLLSILNNRPLLADGAVLASTVIFRLYEEFKALNSGEDDESHLRGGYVFVEIAREGNNQWSKLGQAAFWVHQRQDVLISILRQIPPRTDVSQILVRHPLNGDDVFTWAKKATALAADVTALCFGENSRSDVAFDNLQHNIDSWNSERPREFTPIYFNDDDSLNFPVIQFALEPCLTGFSYYQLSLLFMTACDPRRPRVGSSVATWQRQLQDIVRLLCGVATSNTCPLGRVIASIAIVSYGMWFDNHTEKLRLLTVLQLADRENGWSSFVEMNVLRMEWGLSA